MDLHAHASKRGVFIYGNRCDGLETQIENMLLVRLMTLNTRWLDFDACNFSEKNMKAKDRRDKGASKEGSGRRSCLSCDLIIRLRIVIHWNAIITQEEARIKFQEASMDRGRASPPLNSRQTCPKYNEETFRDVGKGVLLGLLDFKSLNPGLALIAAYGTPLIRPGKVFSNAYDIVPPTAQRQRSTKTLKGRAERPKKSLGKTPIK